MKFGKEFASQTVQEWQQAYMDYRFLKTVLKDIFRFRQRNSVSPLAETPKGSLKRRVSLYRAFSGLTSRYNCSKMSPEKHNEDEVILIEGVSEGKYKTMFLRSSDEGGEYELVFFRRLDDEFNKVLNFYKGKVGEVMEEAEELNKQMDALIALRIRVDNPVMGMNGEANSRTSSSSINGRSPGRSHMDVIQEVEMSDEGNVEDEVRPVNEPQSSTHHKRAVVGPRPPSLEVLNHVKINVTPETPVSTLKCILMRSQSDLSFSKEELRKAEEQMRRAFVEFYQKLRLLKSYCFLNLLAFSKIMKKYDKVTRLVERVESTFIKHFSNGNRKRGIITLRPQARRERHRITFFLGLFSGSSIALLVAIVVLIQARHLLKSKGREAYMANIFPLYSFFGFIILHMIMFSGNIYFWRRFRVNYPFIFGFKQGSELGYREVFLLSSGVAVLTLAGAISNLDMDMDHRTRSFRTITELVPVGLVTLLGLVMFCPFNVIYRSSRFFLLRCVFHCLCAPLYKVTLPDFFLADQLTSQVQAFRCLEFYICYYGWGDFQRRSNKCQQSKTFEVFYIIVAVVPYWTRFLQCLRRLFEERDYIHALNGLKYFSTIVAVVMRTGNDLEWGITWRIMAAASSGVATITSTYWDIVIDWGLLRRNSKNPWLREKLLISNRSVYFVAIVLNVILRLAWMQSVLGFYEAPFLHRTAVTAIVASLEIIRRGIWNFFRLENEHLNNVGKYRAFKSVPLPFNYEDEEKDV
ncbi:phosphate transporter PHO1 homolog 9-like isoform X2 [Rhododendron vialii]|uniref:phosphate transporter PHO1 homolog 9-like isoform X2 n=1 Tax=Rhododendron vialii TaxID=182163 RepID=UPI00265E8A1E|nr:phosphate transporter PHO1 homolog 9-like isoform X2 [Rhododendron vialii]